ncbi:hypothetical protein V8E53_013879 [Lactarius tabidus]
MLGGVMVGVAWGSNNKAATAASIPINFFGLIAGAHGDSSKKAEKGSSKGSSAKTSIQGKAGQGKVHPDCWASTNLTPLDEKLHGPLKKSFLWRTNFRDVAMQILRIKHFSFVSALIRSFINELENIAREADEGATDNQESPSIDTSLGQPAGPKLRNKVVVDGHLSLQSQQPPVPLLSFGDGFHQIVAGWLPHELDASGIRLSEAIVNCAYYLDTV